MYKGTYLDMGALQDCIKSKDYAYVYKRAQEVAKSRNPFVICDFAENVPLADDYEIMELLEDGMIACDDIYHEYEFAFALADSGKKCFNLKRFEKRFRKSGIAKIMYYCLECLVGCDTAKMETALMETRDTKYIELFMNNDEVGHEHSGYWYMHAIENFKREEKSKGIRYVPKQLATLVRGLNVVKDNTNDAYLLVNAGNEYDKDYNPMHINMCAEYTDCDKERAFELMMASDNILHIYEYYCSAASEEEKDVIYLYVLNSEYAKIMYYMIAWTDLPLDKCNEMLDAIEKTRNKKYIEKAKEAIAVKESALNTAD